MTEREIFTAALHQPEGPAREVYLAAACAGDSALRQRVESLLVEHGQLGSFMEVPSAVATIDQPLTERIGTQIGPYKLLQQIGEGGFGVVYMAEQTEPVRRKVALKVIKPGMDTRQVIARFEAERQALAVMDHPNIARVFDAGATESGRPYFVMELVRGIPVTQYCDENNLPVRARLELFASVCQAIQHAHTKGIIHRDIKPTNVLVTRQDGHPAVKVIDFGVAKAMGQQLTEKTLFTEFAQLIGTPLYMSPEQAELSGVDIDTRSDIYSLGVLLYELLTGSTPVSKEQIKQAAFDEVRRIIREEDPPRPSNRISTAEAAPSIAAQRHTEPAKLTKLVRGELDWIVMKALEKDRNRRYETANGFAMDVQRYLADEPVSACPPSAGYRLRKFARRNKAALAMAGVVAIALLLTMIGLAVSNVLVRAERNEKVAALKDKEKALGEKLVALGAKDEALKKAKTNYAEAKRQEGLAQKQEKLAQKQEKLARRRYYAAQLNLASLAWEQGDAARTLELLESLRPAFDQEDLRGFEWYYLWRKCHLGLRARLTQGPGTIQSVAFFPDGKRLASMGGAVLKIWDVETAQEMSSWSNGGGAVAIAPDGKILASWSQWEPVRLWDTTSGRQVDVFQGTKAAAFAPDGKTIALVWDEKVEFWDLATRERRSVLQTLQDKAADSGPDSVGSFVFSPDGKTAVVTSPRARSVTLCRREGAEWRETTVLPRHGWWLPTAFSPDGALLAVGGDTPKLYAADTGQAIGALTGHTGTVYSVAFSPDGQRLASAANDRTVRVWDVATRQQQYSYPHPGPVVSAAFSPDGKWLASCGAYETLRVWDAAPSDEMAVVKLSGGVRGLAFSPNGRTLAACGNSGVSLVDVDLGKVQTTLPAGATSIAFSHDGLRLALGREDRLVELWEMPGSRSYTVLKGHSEVKGFSPTVFSVAFSPDDRWLASAGYDGTVLVWDLATRNVRFTLRPGPNPGNPASAVAFSPDGRSLATGTLGENVRLWDAETGRELLVLQQIDREGSGPWCWSVAFSPDGGALATASQSGQVRLWDTATGRLSASLQGHTAAVRCVAFSPDGVTLATAANEPALRLWDTTTGQETIILTGHADRVSAVAFSRDGTLASGSPDGTVRFWRTSREPAAVARKTELNPDDPGSSAALIDSASRLTAAGRFLEAQQDYEAAQARVAQLTAVDLGKDSTPEAKYSLAEQCSQLGRSLRDKQQLELAARVFRHAISLREPLGEATPESRLAQANDYNDLAFTLKPAKRLQEAEAAVRTGKQLKQALVTEFPEKPEYRFHLAHSCLGLAYLFEESGRTSDALKAFAEADGLLTELAADASATEQLRQWVGQALRQLGDAWLRLNRVNDALDCFSKAILLQPDTSEAWTGRAWAHLHAQHWDQAVADYSKAIELSPQVHTNWFHRGHAHLQLQQWDKATVDFTRVVEGWPDEPGGWYLRALAYAQSSQPDKALSDLRQALAKGFQDAEQIKNDPRLEPLRSNDDFQKLLDELEAKKAATAKQ